MIGLSDGINGEHTYPHLEESVEVISNGLLKIRESVVKEYCIRCKAQVNCAERIKKYNNMIYAEMWKMNKEAKELEAKRFAEKLARELPLRKAESLKKLENVVKVDVPDTVVKIRAVDKERNELENDQLAVKQRTMVTTKFIGYAMKKKLYTDEAEKLYSSVKMDSIVRPNKVSVVNFTNNKEIEMMIRDKLDSGEKIPTLTMSKTVSRSVAKKELEEKEAQREAIKKSIKRSMNRKAEADQYRIMLESKIQIMELK
jgi:hypothetical protein